MKNKFLLPLLLLLVVLEAKAQDKDTYFITSNNDTIPQKDGVDYLIQLFKINRSQEKIENKKVNFSFFPIDARNAGERVLVSSFNATFLLGDKSNTNNSTIYFIPYITFKNQYGVELYPTIWLKENSWNFVGEYFALNFPQDTWGLGGNTPESNETLVDGKQIRFHQNVLKGIFPNFAVGIGYQFDKHYGLEINNADNPDFPDTGTQKSISSGLSFPFVYDNRKNIINPQKGFYSSFTYLYNSPAFGSDNKWQSLFFDVRKYFSIPYARKCFGIPILLLVYCFGRCSLFRFAFYPNRAQHRNVVAGTSKKQVSKQCHALFRIRIPIQHYAKWFRGRCFVCQYHFGIGIRQPTFQALATRNRNGSPLEIQQIFKGQRGFRFWNQ